MDNCIIIEKNKVCILYNNKTYLFLDDDNSNAKYIKKGKGLKESEIINILEASNGLPIKYDDNKVNNPLSIYYNIIRNAPYVIEITNYKPELSDIKVIHKTKEQNDYSLTDLLKLGYDIKINLLSGNIILTNEGYVINIDLDHIENGKKIPLNFQLNKTLANIHKLLEIFGDCNIIELTLKCENLRVSYNIYANKIEKKHINGIEIVNKVSSKIEFDNLDDINKLLQNTLDNIGDEC